MSHTHSHPAEVTSPYLSPDQSFSQSVITVRYDRSAVPCVPDSPSPGCSYIHWYLREACGHPSLSPHVKDTHTLPSWDMPLTVTLHFCGSPVEWQPNETEQRGQGRKSNPLRGLGTVKALLSFEDPVSGFRPLWEPRQVHSSRD